MRKIFTYIFLLVITASCIDDFEEINTNPLYPGDKEKGYDGIAAGAYFVDFEKRVIPTRSSEAEGTNLPNAYQVSINLAGDNWVGYMSPMYNKWYQGLNFTTYYMVDGWVNTSFSSFYTNIVNPWIQIQQQTHDKKVTEGEVTYESKSFADEAVFSVAQIIKIMGLHRATDAFGPIPYTGIGKGDFKVAYDTQEVVYKSFFTELQKAIDILADYNAQGGSRIETLRDFDALYEGDVTQWMKLGNSLMLRLAIRVRYVDENLSKQWISKATTNPGGLIEDITDIAKLETGKEHRFLNSLELIWKNYDDCRMGATIYSYLEGYDDPRGKAYFTKYDKDPEKFKLKAVRTGIPIAATADFYKNYSIPNIFNDTPVYWFKASETYFLLAEAALYGIISESAKDLYEKGIAMSFDENDITAGLNEYLQSSARPANYVDFKNDTYNALSPSSVSVKWEAASTEEYLEKIITQKYLAIYPDGQEAWSEWRRTGYPKQITTFANRTDGTHGNVIDSDGHKYGVRRMPFPRSEYDGINKENVEKAKSLLRSGIDDCNTRVWWDANPNLN